MNLISRAWNAAFGAKERRSDSQTLANAGWFSSLFGIGNTSKSGISVTTETALSHSAVFACAKVLAESVASLPLELFRRESDGDVFPADNHPVYGIVNAEPSPLYTSYDFLSTSMLHLCLHGNSYAYVSRNGVNRPSELRLIDPCLVTAKVDENTGRLWYRIQNVKEPIPAENMLHVKGLSSDGLLGKSPISVFRENIGLGIAATQTAGSLWKNGTLASGYLKHPAKLTPDQAERLRSTWNSRYSGTDNAGSVIVLENGMEYTPLTLKPADAQFIETMKLSIADIARIYRVPLHMIGELDRATFNNIEHLSLEFVRNTLRPWLKNWEQELQRKLLTADEKKRMFFRFNIEGMLRGDTKARAEYYRTMFAIGAMSQNDIRGLENMNKIADGDKYFVPLNMADSSNLPSDTKTGEAQQNDAQNGDTQSEPAASA